MTTTAQGKAEPTSAQPSVLRRITSVWADEWDTARNWAIDPVSLIGAEAVNAKIHQWMATAHALDDQGAEPASEDRRAAPEVASIISGSGAQAPAGATPPAPALSAPATPPG